MIPNTKLKKALQSALQSKDPHAIAHVFELPINKTHRGDDTNNKHNSDKMNKNRMVMTKRSESLNVNGVEWGGVLSSLLDSFDALMEDDSVTCFESQSSLHSSFNHILSSSSGNILIPALHIICRNTYHTAIAADISTQRSSGGRQDHARLQSAVTLLQESFSKTLNDRKEYEGYNNSSIDDEYHEEGSKKIGVLYIVNLLFSMYFRLNTLRLCKNLLRPVESKGLHQIGSKGEMVTYRYYVGRLNMFEDQYDAAEENLDYALKHCHINAVANKKRILNYLLPVKLLRGRLPTEYLLTKYNMKEFLPIVEGIRTGDLRTFNDGLLTNQQLFIRLGTYLLLEKCKTVCYRNLFKRVFVIMDSKPQLSLDHVAKSFKWLGMPIDLDEVECILANLICKGYVRGYISHSKRILVLSKKEPFPKGAVVA